jgi:hypothetical protein
MEEKIKSRLFMGFLISYEINNLLNQSHLWKESVILADPNRLLEVDFEHKRYIGYYLTVEKPTVGEIKRIEGKLRETLKSYCPQFNSESAKIFIFPQVFIS